MHFLFYSQILCCCAAFIVPLKPSSVRYYASSSSSLDQCFERLDQINLKINNFEQNGFLKLDELDYIVHSIQQEAAKETFWDLPDFAQAELEKANRATTSAKRIRNWYKAVEEIRDNLIFVETNVDYPGSELLVKDSGVMLGSVENDICEFETQLYFRDEFDKNDCHLVIQSGSGGSEAQDWANMLLRLYRRFLERKGLGCSTVSISSVEVGIKHVELKVSGEFAYGYLKGERGTHRLIRNSPFNSQDKRQTSFASVEVWPMLPETCTESLVIPDKDLEVTTMRSGGAGGQNVNKIESAVRIRHIPSGLTVKCSDQRSQLQNKQLAMKSLKEKLHVIAREQFQSELAAVKGDLVEATFGRQIRNYVFSPYKLVKDVRTGCETSQVEDVLDGNIDSFITAYLKHLVNSRN